MHKLALKADAVDMVIYHRDCSDGFCAAWAAHRKLGEKAVYLAAKHGDTPPDVRGRRVAIFDFAWDLPTMLKLVFLAKQLVVIDHHKSAQDALLGKMPAHTTWFEMEQSAATMAWHYFFPTVAAPPFISFVQDRDLWRFSSEESRGYCAFLDTLPLQFEAYDSQVEEKAFKRSILAGQTMLEYQNIRIHEALERSCERRLRGYRVREVNITMWMSEAANELAARHPECDFAVVWNYSAREKIYLISVRSVTDTVDVSALCTAMGGGGHPRAGGFKWTKSLAELWDAPADPKKATVAAP